MELTVERLVRTEKIDGTTEEKAVLKGESDEFTMTFTISGGDVIGRYAMGDAFLIEMKPVQTKLDDIVGPDGKPTGAIPFVGEDEQ